MEAMELEKKMELILDKLERIEAILLMEEVEPEEDELEAVKEYLEKKRRGKLELIPMGEALQDVLGIFNEKCE